MNEIVLILPQATRAYGEPEAIGPFSPGFAQDYIDNHMTIEPDYEALVIPIQDPGI